jgi:hypothetical protein
MFWVLDRPAVRLDDCIYATISGAGDKPTWQSSICPTCGRSKFIRQVRDLSVELYGSLLLDFVWMDSPDILVRATLMELLRNSPLAGLAFRKVNIVAWWQTDPTTQETIDWLVGNPAPELFQLLVLGKGGSILPQNKPRIESACTVCGTLTYAPLEKGIFVDPSQWDGSDIFVMQEFPGYVLVTERFLHLLTAHQIQNYIAIPAEEFSMI